MTTYYPGDTARIETTFRETTTNTLVDPATIIFRVRNGKTRAISVFTYGVEANVQRASLGVYYCDVVVANPGQWTYRIEATGAAAGVQEGSFLVSETLVN